MPQVTVYIKREDMKRWAAIKYKADFIRRALDNESGASIKQKNPTGGVKSKSSVNKQIEKIEELKTLIPGLKPASEFAQKKIESNGICSKHGTPLDFRGHCMQKGCK